MKNIKLELFNFKKDLSLDQEEIAGIIENHMSHCGVASEKRIITSLNEKLRPYTYDKSVKGLLEGLNADMAEFKLVYELKDLYNVLCEKNVGELYRQPINVLLQCINESNDSNRMVRVLNELAIYDWVPEIKLFVANLTTSPEKRSNLLSGGKSNNVYSIVEQTEGGHVVFVKDSWFSLSEDKIEKTLLENHVKDAEQLRVLRTLETALKFATISEDKIDFRISEYLTVGIGLEKKGTLYINEEVANAETTLESLFNSPIVPIVNKNFYPLLLETANNLDKFIELDIVKKVTNLINPFLEVHAFNYKNNIFVYRCDERYGNSLFSYDSAAELVNELKGELNYDLTYFYEDKLSDEVVVKRRLEDKERELTLTLEDVNFNIDKVKSSMKVLGGSPILETALVNLEKRKEKLDADIFAVKELQSTEKIKIG